MKAIIMFRKSSRAAFFFFLALFLPVLCGSESPAFSENDVMKRLEAKEKETSAVAFDFTQKVEFDIRDGYVQENSGSVIFRKPENLRIELKKPVRQITVSDGKKLKNYNADTNQYIVSDWKKVRETGILFGWPDSFAGNVAHLKEKYALKVVESSTDTLRMSLEDKKSGFSMTMEFDAGTLDPRSTELSARGVKITTSISGFRRNPELPRDAFKFDAPRGAEVIRP